MWTSGTIRENINTSTKDSVGSIEELTLTMA
jgi:hypothetical protein